MSFHYQFMMSLPLSPKMVEAHSGVLEYIFNGAEKEPASLPENYQSCWRLHKQYQGFENGTWQSCFWVERNREGSINRSGVNLNLPGQKLEGVIQNLFALADWLVTLSDFEGCIGMVISEDQNDEEPMMLFCNERRFYVGQGKKLKDYVIDTDSWYLS